MAKTSPATFVRQVRQEVSRVTWPTRKETGVSMLTVVLLASVAAVFFMLVDGIISFLLRQLLGFDI